LLVCVSTVWPEGAATAAATATGQRTSFQVSERQHRQRRLGPRGGRQHPRRRAELGDYGAAIRAGRQVLGKKVGTQPTASGWMSSASGS
jgi:hypothetical protein